MGTSRRGEAGGLGWALTLEERRKPWHCSPFLYSSVANVAFSIFQPAYVLRGRAAKRQDTMWARGMATRTWAEHGWWAPPSKGAGRLPKDAVVWVPGVCEVVLRDVVKEAHAVVVAGGVVAGEGA